MKAYEQIGRRLQQTREEAGMSQEELANVLGYTQSSLSNYELGKRRLSFTDLQRIGQILGKPITYFLDDGNEETMELTDLETILRGPYLKDIVYASRDLKSNQRRAVLDYILWQKSKTGGAK
jgi:transcriptional regulator with XRE-family HTH domain